VICSFAVFECGRSGKWTVSKMKVSPFYVFFLAAARLFYSVEEGYWPKWPFLFVLLFHVFGSFAVFECGRSGKWTVLKKKASPFYVFFLAAARLFYSAEEGYCSERPFLFVLFHVICSSFAVFECGRSGLKSPQGN